MNTLQSQLRVTVLLLLLIVCGCAERSDEPKEVKIETPDGPIYSHETTVDSTPQKITVITGEELADLKSLSELGPPFVSHYLPKITTPTLKDYDAAFHAWQLDSSPTHTEQQVIDIVGAYLGNKMVADLDMQWVTVKDEYGTDYAVQGSKFKVVSFPFSSVRKSVEDETHDFVYAVYYIAKKLRAEADLKAKPTSSQE